MMNFLFNAIDLLIYLIVDNITKIFIVRNGPEYRLNILTYECLVLGFLSGFLLIYSHIPYVLFVLLVIHVLGTIFSEKQLDTINRELRYWFRIAIELFQTILKFGYNLIKNRLVSRSSSSRQTKPKAIPKEWLYNYHLKPSNDLRQDRTKNVAISQRPGIINLHGTTCSLNALLQSLASSECFYQFLKQTTNLSRISYDSIVTSFLDVLSQLRRDHRISESKHWNRPVDTSLLVSRLNQIHPGLLNPSNMMDIAELFQRIVDALNNALSSKSIVYSANVIKQVYHQPLTTLSLSHLNKIFTETDAELQQSVTLENLDEKTSDIIQYVDVTWLLHHIQQGSVVKHALSGQILHAYCYEDSRVRFRTEPFQIFSLPINVSGIRFEELLRQFTKIELIDSVQSTSENRLSSSRSSHHRIKLQTMITHFPEILCIQLKRFTHDRRSSRSMKLQSKVLIDPEKILDLSSLHYSTWLGLTNFSSNIFSRYRLIAVCLHLSDSKSSNRSVDGHYVCLYRADYGRWFLSDDERVTEIHQTSDLFQSSYVSENCYLLFFERCQ